MSETRGQGARALDQGRSAVLAALATLLFSAAAVGQAAVRHEVKIDAQPVAAALKALAAQTGLQILVMSEDAGNKQAPAIRGYLTNEEVLEKILRDTGLTYEKIDENTVAIRPADASHPPAATVGPQEERASQNTPEALQEVIVTAQKREERLIDVPMSIVAVSADELEKRRVTTLEDLPSVVPDLAITNAGTGRFIEVRGISNQSGNASLIGMYVDEADVTIGGAASTQINPVLFDLERVEVLRGPQGTLYGEGSAGGTIRFITKNPNLRKFTFDSAFTALFTENGGPSQRINAAVNVPLVDSQLGLRVAGTFEHDGGWIDQPVADQRHINWQDLTNVRIKGLWKPTSDLTISAMAIINRNDRSTDASDTLTPLAWTQVFGLSTTPRLKNDYNLYNLTMSYDISPAIRILNTTSYLESTILERNQGFSYQETEPGTPRYDYYAPVQSIEDRILTDELRLTSTGTGPWQWTIGGFYRRQRDNSDTPIAYFDILPFPEAYSFPYSAETLSKSWSAFGDSSYKLLNWFTLGAGLRYFQERQEFTDFIAMTGQAARFHSLDPRVYAQFKLSSGANVYASAAKGFRSGGFNGLADQPPFNPENVWTYELGTKMEFAERRAAFDVALFWSDYADYQTLGTVVASPLPFLQNAGRARIKGIEWDMTWHPVHAFTWDVRGSYLNGRFTEINAGSTAYAVGDPLDLVPRYQFGTSGQYEFSWLGRPGSVRVDYSQTGPKPSRSRTIGPWSYDESDVIRLLNFRASLVLNNNLSAGFFVQNLANDQGFVTPFDYQANGVRSRPRTYGLDFSVTFD